MMPQTCPGSVISPDRGRSQRGRIALLVGLAWSVGVSLGASAATTWTVCASGCDYRSIKAAIAAPTTLDGDTLAVAAGAYTEAGITIAKSLTLQGESADTTIVQAAATPGTAADRVFTIPSGVTVTLQALTIRYGKNRPNEGGGGIRNDGTLTLTKSIIHNNVSSGGGGLLNLGTLTVASSTIRNNFSHGGGGGLLNLGRLTVTSSTIHRNSARGGGSGGGIANHGQLTLTASTVSHNSTGNGVGGGIANTTAGSLLTLTASTIRDNSANYLGGGLYNSETMMVTSSTVSGNSAANGGGFLNYGRLTLTASTITGNSATSGGGVFNYNTLTLTASTITGNAASSGGGILNYSRLTLTNSLVAKNLSGRDCDTINTVGSSITSLGYNLDSDGSCQLTGSTDWPGVDPLLGPVQNNGGPTRTHALLPGSPAVDAIPWGTNGCGTTLISDQRWEARPQPAGGACDIGAYEVTVAGQPLSAWMTGLTPDTAVCKNVTTGQEVTLNDPVVPWDCEAAGLAVTSGDHITLRVRGPVQQGATDVGGAVVGMAPRSGGCTNRTTGQQVTFQHLVGATAGSCVAAGLVVQPGDHVQIHVQGVAE